LDRQCTENFPRIIALFSTLIFQHSFFYVPMTEIHNNLPPIELPFFTTFDWTMGAVFLLVICFLLWKIFFQKLQKKQTREKTKKIQKKFVPEKFSLKQEVEKLKHLQEQENWKQFSLEATRLLKKILEQKFLKNFAFATGKELEEILQEQMTAHETQNIHQFFALLDPIKFAQAEGKNEIAEKVLDILTTLQ